MKLFDSLTKDVEAAANKAVSSATSFFVTGATAKLNEAMTAVSSTFGDATAPFRKIGANTPSYAEYAAANRVAEAKESDATASAVNDTAGKQKVSNDYKVILTEKSNGRSVTVEFDVMPEIVESHTVEYEAVAPPQSPGAFQKYKGTSSTVWTLNVTLISRTPLEATNNLNRLNILRGWKMPFFGDKTATSFPKMLGAPPPVLRLSGLRTLVGPVPVVITSLNWNWPKDVDYITTNDKRIPFPAVMQIAIGLVESFSTAEFNAFSLKDYRSGSMSAAFQGPLQSATLKGGVEQPPSGAGRKGEDVASDAITRTPSLRSGRSEFTDAEGKRLGMLGTTVANLPNMAYKAASDFGQNVNTAVRALLPQNFTVGTSTGLVRDQQGVINNILTENVARDQVIVPMNAYIDDSYGKSFKTGDNISLYQMRATTEELNAVKQAMVAISQRIADVQGAQPINYINLALAQKQLRDLMERHTLLSERLQGEVS